MKTEIITLSQLIQETENSALYILSFNHPFFPMTFSIKFDNMAQCIGGPFLSLWSDTSELCLSYITSIKRIKKAEESSYLLKCDCYNFSGPPDNIEIMLKTIA